MYLLHCTLSPVLINPSQVANGEEDRLKSLFEPSVFISKRLRIDYIIWELSKCPLVNKYHSILLSQNQLCVESWSLEMISYKMLFKVY